MKYDLDDLMRTVYQEEVKPNDILNQKTLQRMKESGNMEKSVGLKKAAVAAVIAGALSIGGVGVYASGILNQIHITGYTDVDRMIKDNNIQSWDVIGYESGTFDESNYKTINAESLVDRLLGAAPEEYTLVEGSDGASWKKMISSSEKEEDWEYYECYEYDKLSKMFSDYNIPLNMSFIESNFTTLCGEYGCDFAYENSDKKNCVYRRFVAGNADEKGRRVGIEYYEDTRVKNEDPKTLYENSITTGYMYTKDGAEVFVTKGTGSLGGKRIDANVMTDHARLSILLYGDFTDPEVEEILNSMEIVNAMGGRRA